MKHGSSKASWEEKKFSKMKQWKQCLSLTRMIWIIKHASVKAVTEPFRWQVSWGKAGRFGLLNLSNKFYFFFFLKKWLDLYNVIRVPRELILHFITGRSSEKAMATHSSILAWRIPWTRSLAGCSPYGHTELDTTEVTILWPPDLKNWLIWKEGDDRGWDGWMASLTRRTWVWASSGNWW